MAPLPHQSPLVSDPAWRAGPSNSIHHQTPPRPYYASPFQEVRVGPGPAQSILAGLSRLFAPLDNFLNRHPHLVVILRSACLLLFLASLLLSLRDACRWWLAGRSSGGGGVRGRHTFPDGGAAVPAAVLEKNHRAGGHGKGAKVTRGLRPGSLFCVPDEPVVLIPDGADFMEHHGDLLLVPTER